MPNDDKSGSHPSKPTGQTSPVGGMSRRVSIQRPDRLPELDSEMLAAIMASQNTIAELARTSNLGLTTAGVSGIPVVTAGLNSLSLYPFESPELAKVRAEANDLRNNLHKALSQVEAKDKSAHQKDAEIENLKKTLEEFQQKNALSYLLERVDPKAHAALLGNERFRDQFNDKRSLKAYVVSVDIRRSTELMLKASSAEAFAKFISQVSYELSRIIKSHFGVVDKFTGDGILGFFPFGYSGEDAGARAIKAADECHDAFRQLYDGSFASFDTVLLEVGLGIGIDFGDVHLMRVTEGLTVIGRPVVYACRLSSAPAGSTFINESARTALSGTYKAAVHFERVEHKVKHEGQISVSRITHFDKPDLKDPDWLCAEETTK